MSTPDLQAALEAMLQELERPRPEPHPLVVPPGLLPEQLAIAEHVASLNGFAGVVEAQPTPYIMGVDLAAGPDRTAHVVHLVGESDAPRTLRRLQLQRLLTGTADLVLVDERPSSPRAFAEARREADLAELPTLEDGMRLFQEELARPPQPKRSPEKGRRRWRIAR